MDKEVRYAPVIIPTLNRYEHLKRCISSLQRSPIAHLTDLYIGVDYPPAQKYEEGYKKVCEYLKEGITGFASVNVILHETNLGAYYNGIFLIEMIQDSYDYFIFTEDDNEFAPSFLDYMNQQLQRYIDDDDVFGIYCASPKIQGEYIDDNNTHMMKFFSAYGNGNWTKKRKEQLKKITRDYIEEIACNKKVLADMKAENPVTICALASAVLRKERVYCNPDGTVPLIDMIYMIYAIAENKYIVCSRKPLVKNGGYDGSGENCVEDDMKEISRVVLDEEEEYSFNDVFPVQRYHLKKDNSFRLRVAVFLSQTKLSIWRFIAKRKLQ